MNKLPLHIKIIILVLMLLIATFIVIINQSYLNSSYFKRLYKYYYLVFAINVINLICILIYYDFKNKEIKGNMGDKGNKGQKGDIGLIKSCENNNLVINFFEQKELYDNFQPININLIPINGNENGNPNQNDLVKNLDLDNTNLNYIDISFLTNNDGNLTPNQLNYINKIKIIFNNETRIKLLNNHINKILQNKKNISNFSLINIFKDSNNSLLSIGDTINDDNDIDNSEELDIMFVDGVDAKTPTTDIIEKVLEFNENNDTKIYIYKLNSILENNFVSLGNYFTVNTQITDDILTNYAIIKKNRTVKLDYDDYYFIGIKIIFETNKLSKFGFKINNTEYDKYFEANNLHFFSIWKTVNNTFVVHSVDNTTLYNNTLGYNLLDGNLDYFEKDEMTIKEYYESLIINKLSSIKLPLIFRLFYITSIKYNEFFKEIQTYIEENLLTLLNEEKQTIEKNIKTNKSNNDKDKLYLEEINNKITNLNTIKDSIINDDIYEDIENILNKNNFTLLINEIPDYDVKFQSKIDNIPKLIENNKTLYDLLLIIFPDGLDTILIVNTTQPNNGGMKLNKIQTEILKLSKCCFPPNHNIYKPKI